MNENKNLKGIFQELDFLILCGGQGKRLRPVIGERQKTVADIDGKPFLGILIDDLRKKGFRRFVLLTGYRSRDVKEYIAKTYRGETNIEFVFSEEGEPLGTGGALKNALSCIKSNTFFLANGDTFFETDLDSFFNYHVGSGSIISLALARGDRSDGGHVVIGEGGLVHEFREKEEIAPPFYLNSGMYIMNTSIASLMPEGPRFSLEHDLFPEIAKTRRCFGFIVSKGFHDIGTPERYRAASDFIKHVDII